MEFATGKIKSYHRVALTDDINCFSNDNPAPVVCQETVDQYPEIKSILEEMGPSLDTGTYDAIKLSGQCQW